MLTRLTTITATALTVFTLGACTSQTQKCSGSSCDIDLSGVGASVELGGEDSGGSELELIGASGRTAQVELAGRELELTIGEPVSLDNATLELVEVEGEDDVQIKLSGIKD